MKETLSAEGRFGFGIKSCNTDTCEIRRNSSGMYVQVAIFSMVAFILAERLMKY